MTKLLLAAAFLVALGCACPKGVCAQTPAQTPPPLEVPPLDPDSPETVIIGLRPLPSPAPPPQEKTKSTKGATAAAETLTFDPKSHQRANAMSLINKEYAQPLWLAMYGQDVYHQIESKAHFDNCAFDLSLDYIGELLEHIDRSVRQAERYEASGKKPQMTASVVVAFYTLGQALHGVQDFYSHTNYVELMRGQYGALHDVPVVPVWTGGGRAQVKTLSGRGLFSGVVSWGFPKQCPQGFPSHGRVAKDTSGHEAGRVVVAEWGNVTQHAAALELARRASREFVIYAFGRWPLLMRVGGGVVAFDVFQERRKF